MNTLIEELQRVLGIEKVKSNEPMDIHTSFRAGGVAQYYVIAETTQDIYEIVALAKTFTIPVFIFGGGSYCIFSEEGFRGIVIKNNCRKFELLDKDNKKYLYTESGALVNQLVRFTVDRGLAGFEYQLGLPGTIGGGIYMNSINLQKNICLGDILFSAKLLTRQGEIKEVDNSYFQFAFDKSILQETKEIVLSAVFMLTRENKDRLEQRAQEAFVYRNTSIPKGESRSYTFRKFSVQNSTLSLATIMEEIGLYGKVIGNVAISQKYPNFLLNNGNAKSDQVIHMIEAIQSEVASKFHANFLFNSGVVEV